MAPLHAAKITVGDVFEEIVVDNLTRTQIVMYAGASGDFHPCHSDGPFVQGIGIERGVFAHGMLTMALTGKMLTHFVGDGRLTKYGASFRAQVWPGDTLTARASIAVIRAEGGESFVDLELTTVNQDGVEVMLGTATARIES